MPFPYTLGSGQSVTFDMIFAPSSAQAASGTITFHSNASNPDLVLSFSGTGVAPGKLTATPASLGFGSIPTGTSSTQTLTVTNTGGAALTVTQITSTSSPTANAFATSGFTPPVSLSGGQSVTFQVMFTPGTSGSFQGNLSLVPATGGKVSVAETGTGMAPGVLSVTPASVSFGNVTVGSSQSQTITLSASGNPVTVSSDSLGSSEYAVSGLALPLTLAAGQSLPVTVTFSPQASGAANTSLAFATSSGSSNPVLTALTGTGVAATQHSVTLSWQPPSSQVAGYNVYRGSQAGGPYAKINGSTDGSTNFADDSVQAGNSYYYEVTSVDGSGMESIPSSAVAATVPSP